MKLFTTIFLSFFAFSVGSQNNEVLYGFAGLPQTISLNPGAETSFKFHVSIPFLSGVSSGFGISGFQVSDFFSDNNIAFNNKISMLSLSKRDHMTFNSKIEILNGGFRLNDRTYLSIGFYNEVDMIGYVPRDMAILATDGNASHLNKSFSFSHISFKADLLGVLHAGITRKIDEKLTVGASVKIYSSSLNAQSINNYGSFTTVSGENNLYVNYFNNVNVDLETSGVTRSEDASDGAFGILADTFLSGNLGLGLDVGFTYHLSNQIEVTGSLLDVGFIHYSKNIKNYKVKGSFVFEGINLRFNEADPIDYWAELDEAFNEQLPITDNTTSYTAWRPAKIYSSLKYSFGEQRSRLCYDDTFKNYFANAMGVQVFTIFRPLSSQVALTAFYERAFAKKFHMKITYTLDDYSLYNIGAGLSAQIGPVNFYTTVGNITEYTNLENVNSISFQAGVNLIFN
jgi:hypothetical protein